MKPRKFNSNTTKNISHRCGAVIFNSDLTKIVLVLNRYFSEKKNINKWGLPKGHIDKKNNESFIKCAERETFEETGLKVRISSDSVKIQVNKTNYYPMCLKQEYELSPSDKYEIKEAKWVLLKDLEKLNLNYELKLVLKKMYRFKSLGKLNKVHVFKKYS